MTRIVIAMLLAVVLVSLIVGCPHAGRANARPGEEGRRRNSTHWALYDQNELLREQNDLLLRIAVALEVMAEIDAEKTGDDPDE